MFYIKPDFISKSECDYFISLAAKPDNNIREKYGEDNPLWEHRVINITNHHIVNRLSDHINEVFNMRLEIEEAQIQNWIEGSESLPHTHERWPQVKYNSLIYLNDNFEGGEFYTPNLTVKPKPGLLTLFDGGQVEHGLKQVKNNDRFTLIFWWKK